MTTFAAQDDNAAKLSVKRGEQYQELKDNTNNFFGNIHKQSPIPNFLYRLHYLLEGKIENIQTDNGSEFHKYFDTVCTQLQLDHYWSWVKTPKDNAVNERFNRTLQEEFIQLGHLTADVPLFNTQLTEWLVEYNFKRPHQTLDYMPPMNFHYKYHKVLPMYPSSTLD